MDNLMDMARRLKELRDELDLAKAAASELQKQYDYLSIVAIPEKMDEEGVESMSITGVGRLQVRSDIRCNVTDGNKELVIQWLRENGHQSLVTPAVSPSTLKALVKEAIKNQKPYPEGIAVHPYSRATIVKS